MEPISLIVWTYAIVFASTAAITLGGLIENFRLIKVKDEYMKGLYTALILEVIAGAVIVAPSVIHPESQKSEGADNSSHIDSSLQDPVENNGLKSVPPIDNSIVENLENKNLELEDQVISLEDKVASLEVEKDTQNKLIQELKKTRNDFADLQELVSQSRWQEADQQTDALITDLGLNCKNLQIINSIWLSASENNFGYSVQRNIWDQYKQSSDYEKFADQVNWRYQGKWSFSSETLVTAEKLEGITAIKGQFPFNGWQVDSYGARKGFGDFMKTLESCDI